MPRSPPCAAVEPDGVCLRQVRKVGAALELRIQIVSLRLGGSQICSFVSASLHRDENFTQPHRFWLREVAQMLLVKLLQLGLRHLDVAPNLVADHLLGDDAVADVLLEVLVGDTLAGCSFLQVFHRIEVVLLANVIEAPHQLGLTCNVQVLALGEQQLLVDQIAQQIALVVLELLFRPALLPRLLVQLARGAVVVRGTDDLVIDLGHPFLNHAAPERRRLRFRIEFLALCLLFRGQGLVGLLLGEDGNGQQATSQQADANIGTAKGHESLYLPASLRAGGSDQK